LQGKGGFIGECGEAVFDCLILAFEAFFLIKTVKVAGRRVLNPLETCPFFFFLVLMIKKYHKPKNASGDTDYDLCPTVIETHGWGYVTCKSSEWVQKAHHMGESFRSPVQFPGKADKAAPHDGLFMSYPTFCHAIDCSMV
jgi:hypothetical protein